MIYTGGPRQWSIGAITAPADLHILGAGQATRIARP